jgi:hypothetical protein
LIWLHAFVRRRERAIEGAQDEQGSHVFKGAHVRALVGTWLDAVCDRALIARLAFNEAQLFAEPLAGLTHRSDYKLERIDERVASVYASAQLKTFDYEAERRQAAAEFAIIFSGRQRLISAVPELKIVFSCHCNPSLTIVVIVCIVS